MKKYIGRGAFRLKGKHPHKRDENVDLSNANIGKNPMPRKPKGSSIRFIHGGRYGTELTHAILQGKA
ncbi:hypothetical protein CXB51_019419 [Gossypium anomalum]|uniref:Uncharacterized protein n=1 Tax=Gossypium anomalum TaxID=47600 RepID=A0A8J5YAA7_9ROSI|nr:hypothetical protein CXB51_019419 [Gossypium anomalum]